MRTNEQETIEWWVDDIIAEIKLIKSKGATKQVLLSYLDSWESTLKNIKNVNNN
jgi:hypothetical protein